MLNKIAYVDLSGRIATVKPDGTDAKLLTGDRRIFQYPSWATGKNQIAAVGINDNGGGLYVISDKVENSLTYPELYFSHNQIPFYHYWSPDDQNITFLTTHPQGFGLRIANMKGSGYLLTTGQPLFWSWTTEPNMLFIHSGHTNPDARLTFIGTAGEGWGDNIASPGYFQAPAVSPDGRFYAFAAIDAVGQRQLVVEQKESGQKLVFAEEGMLAMRWSPEPSLLAYIAGIAPDGRFYGPLRLIDTQTQQKERLVDQNVMAFFWSPNGRKIAYLKLTEMRTIRPLDMQTRQYVPSTSMYTNGTVPHTLAAEKDESLLYLDLHVYDIRTGRDQFLTTVAPPITFLNQYLPFFDQYSLSHRLWSPNSDQLVLPTVEGSTAVIKIVPINGQPIRTVAEGLMPSWSHY